MMLCDRSIRAAVGHGVIGIDPAPRDDAYQPASVDLRLDNSFLSTAGFAAGKRFTAPPDGFWLAPDECVLACTLEAVTLPPHLVGRVEGKSSWGRRFIQVHSTAGFIDPGFRGQITLELKNLSRHGVRLPLGCYIAQISFQTLDAPAERPYGAPGLGSHYQGQRGATPPC